MVADGALHGGDDVGALVGVQQQQDSLGLMFAVTLLLQQSFQEASRHLAQFGESLPQQINLLAMVARRPMSGLQPPLSGLTQQAGMPGPLPKMAVVDEQFRVGDAHRQQFAHQPPGRGVLVAGVVNEALHIDDAINDPRRVVIMLGKRQQVR